MNKNNKPDYKLKIVLIGEHNCGVTSILYRYRNNTFDSFITSSLGLEFEIITTQISGEDVLCLKTTGVIDGLTMYQKIISFI